MEKIYNLCVIYSNDEKLTNNSFLYKELFGYYTSLEKLKDDIKKEIAIYFKDNYIHKIYCNVIETNTLYQNSDIVINFNIDGEIIKEYDYDNSKITQPKYKIGDFVSICTDNIVKVGVITQLPKIDNTYTIYYSTNNKFMDHTHCHEEDLYLIEHLTEDTYNHLVQTLKKCVDTKTYNYIKRIDKLKNILK